MASVELWIIGALVTILIAVLSAFGAIVKIAYDTAGELEVVLHGRTREQKGFIQKSRDTREDLKDEQEEIREQLLMQGRLINEVSYALLETIHELETEEDIDADVNVDRIEDLRERHWEVSDHD